MGHRRTAAASLKRERERERREQRDTSTDPIDDRLVGLVVVVFVLATLIWDAIQ